MPVVNHLQDAAIVVEALVQFAGNPNELDAPREERAYELAEAIAADHGMRPSELVRQVDDEWAGPG